MNKLTGNEIIKTFLNYFEEHGHKVMESASLVPHDDPSVLWVNAGVTPLKKYFDGSIKAPSKRLVSVQKCIRTGDIEEVGKTARHHTFFQMLGNFSIGDYFKKEALTMAYDLLTNKKYFGIDKDKLYVTIYPKDKEAREIWLSLGVSEDHIIPLEGNFWCIGPGPAGPDSEIFYDRGKKYDPNNEGIKLLQEEKENDRYIEIWNNVFSQFNAKENIPLSEYPELPSKNIDTGMGVERMAMILGEYETNYETDLFMPIMDEISNICHIKYYGQTEFKIIADHLRTLVFALSDGAVFENVGRGYVLRRLLRRAVRESRKLKINHSFLASLVTVVVDKYKEVYPTLVAKESQIKELITSEEELFQKTLASGEKRLEEIFSTSSTKVVSGIDAFKLYDTYGFPIELTTEIAEEKGFTVAKDEFDKYMQMQKNTSKANHKKVHSMNLQSEVIMNLNTSSTFVGYESLKEETEINAIIRDDELVNSSTAPCLIVLKSCPFYAESGGQTSDEGLIIGEDFKLEVEKVIKSPNKEHLIYVNVLEGIVKTHAKVSAVVDKDYRQKVTRNHSSVHILQKVLQDILGKDVYQDGSKVDDETFRFDFHYHGKMSDELITKVESKLNELVKASIDTKISYMKLPEAKEKGAMALFEDKYEDIVRVVEIGDSIELCGGCHVKNTSEISKIAIARVENKGTDTYRVIGASGESIPSLLQKEITPYNSEMIKQLEKAKKIINKANELNIKLDFDFNINNDAPNCYADIVSNKLELSNLKSDVRRLEEEFEDKKREKVLEKSDEFIKYSEKALDKKVLIAITNNYDNNSLKLIVDNLSNKLSPCFILLSSINGESVNFICKKNFDSENINCASIIKELTSKSSGSGGGNVSYATGGGKKIVNLNEELKTIKKSVISHINS